LLLLLAVIQRDIEAALRTSRQGNLLRQGLQASDAAQQAACM
jgi:hypothetical protein